MHRTFYILLLFIFASTSLIAQSSLHKALSDKYSRLTLEKAPGFFIGIIQSGNPVLARSFGMANVEHEIPFSAQTVSDLGSVSKQLTVMGILLLKEEGSIDLDDNINQHLPELPALNKPVTIRHLIHHTSGIPDVYALHSLKGFRFGDHISQSDAYRFIKARPTVDFDPGSKYRYSNTGYMLLAEIISEVSGMKFEVFMKEKVFKPLGMDHTFIMDIPGEIYSQMADSYIPNGTQAYTKIYDNSTLQGGGGVYASGHDVLKWIDNFRVKKVGDSSSFRFILSNATLNDGSEIDYAGGINVDTYRGIIRYHHNGSSAAARTRLVYYPEHELGFVIKSNTTIVGYRDFNQMEDLIIDHYLNEYAQEILKDQEEEPQDKVESIEIDTDEYTGVYINDNLDLSIHVEVSENSLQLSNFYYAFSSLSYVGNDHFQNNIGRARFKRSDEGIIISMILDVSRASGIEFIRK